MPIWRNVRFQCWNRAGWNLNFYASRLTRSSIDFRSPMDWQRWLDLPDLKLSLTTQLGHRTWKIICNKTDHFRSAEWFIYWHWVTFLSGLILTFLLIFYLLRLKSSMNIRLGMALELQESERLLSVLFHHSPDIIRVVDVHGVSLLVNRSTTLEKADPCAMLDMAPVEFQKIFLHALNLAFQQGETTQFHYHQMAHNLWWEVRVVPLRDNEEIVNAMVVTTDITENKMLEEQAAKNSRLASLGLLAAGVAHEINNPNNSIYYNANMLGDAWRTIRPILNEYYVENGDFAISGLPYSEMADKIPRMIGWILENTQRIQKIVDQLKHLVRNNSQEHFALVDLAQVIQGALLLMNTTIQKHTDFFTCQMPDTLPQVMGNSQQLEQVLINVLMNAIQSLPDRTCRVELEVCVEAKNREILLFVRDQGCGIADAYLEKITEPFFTTRLEKGGTGLGLSISATIIKAHSGRLHFQSNVGYGTTVTIHLPISAVETLSE
ncbi:MAG: ATP-binding protein [Magnetococcus sp. DMHC-6]